MIPASLILYNHSLPHANFLLSQQLTAMSLTSLPNELQFEIISHLPTIDKLHLSKVSRRYNSLIPPPTRDQIYQYRLALERSDEHRLRRVCTRCIRLLPFYHFSSTQSSPATKASKRICLFCHVNDPIATHQAPADVAWLFGTKIGVCQFCKTMVLCTLSGKRLAHGCPCGFCNQPIPDGTVVCMCRIHNRFLWGRHDHTDPSRWEHYLKLILPHKPAFIVTGLVERLDACETKEELVRLKMDGRTIGSQYGELDPVGCYVRETEEMLLRAESVGAEKYRQGIWRTQGSKKLAGSDYFPSIEKVQTCAPPTSLVPMWERVREMRKVNHPPAPVARPTLWGGVGSSQFGGWPPAAPVARPALRVPNPRTWGQVVRDAVRSIFGYT
ncbi:hypothetical protein BDD12DRAFT_829063 [Trichophaea hybrida]|nr:hypothetical protein BDD12DRAFT_829063 [Trichophaea hybrida]